MFKKILTLLNHLKFRFRFRNPKEFSLTGRGKCFLQYLENDLNNIPQTRIEAYDIGLNNCTLRGITKEEIYSTLVKFDN